MPCCCGFGCVDNSPMTHAIWRRLWNTRREALFDITLVLAIYAMKVVLGWIAPTNTAAEDFEWMGGAWLVHLLAGGEVFLLVRRRFPLVPMFLMTALTIGQTLAIEFAPGPLFPVNLSTDPWVPIMTPWAVYAFAVYATGKSSRAVGWSLFVVVTATAIRPWDLPATDVLTGALLLTVIPALIGLYVSARRKLMRELRDRAERAEREQHLLAEQARAEERTRLASEMHDVVTNRLSLMVLQAGALGISAKDDETRHAADELRAGGCQALGELRDLVGVLRRGPIEDTEVRDARLRPLPDLSKLVEESATAGVSVSLVEQGSPSDVAPTVSRTAYRVVQEALTNVYKHALGAAVEVRVSYSDERVRLTIRNAPPSEPIVQDLAASGSGSGLTGLTQRVELIGGALSFGSTADGGFEVDAILPTFVPTGES